MIYDEDAQLKEIDEVIYAADRALMHLQNARNEINSASGWGILDMMGGGLVSTYVKRDHMRQAQREVAQAQDAIQMFNRELQDVTNIYSINMNMDGFLGMADYLFDGILSDVFVYDQIKEMQSRIDDSIYQLERIRAWLIEKEEEIVSHRIY